MNVCLLSPGEMGAAIGAQLVAAGHQVLWASQGRRGETVERAREAGLEDAGTIARAVGAAGVVLSVVPPQFALGTATAVASCGFQGVFVDANAIAPSTATDVATTVTSAGARFVDGGIVGSPPTPERTTRLYLSGPRADAVVPLFAGTTVEAVVVPGGPTAASALKLAYAAWTKGSAALLLAAHELAVRSGVESALEAEWERSLPELATRLAAARASGEKKGWRWTPEMHEIAAAMRSVDLPPGFHEAAASIFEAYPRP